jgi:hypothetical protein
MVLTEFIIYIDLPGPNFSVTNLEWTKPPRKDGTMVATGMENDQPLSTDFRKPSAGKSVKI